LLTSGIDQLNGSLPSCYRRRAPACPKMTSAAGFSYGPMRPAKGIKDRNHVPACERGQRTAMTPPCGHRATARCWLTPRLSCLNETVRLEVSNRQ